jgi:hypothetical protein
LKNVDPEALYTLVDNMQGPPLTCHTSHPRSTPAPLVTPGPLEHAHGLLMLSKCSTLYKNSMWLIYFMLALGYLHDTFLPSSLQLSR